MTDKTYWAATDDPHELADRLKIRIKRFRDACELSGRRHLWARASRMFYGLDPEGGYRTSHYVQFEGAQGQFLGSRLNLYRSFAKSMLVMIVGSRAPHACIPIAYDADTTEVVTIGNAYLDQIMNDGVESLSGDAAIRNLTMGEGWLLTTWDDGAGDIIMEKVQDPMTGEVDERPKMNPVQNDAGEVVAETPVCSGEQRVISLRPDQVIRDPDNTGDPATSHHWLCAAVQRSRWELIAQYPLYAKQIREAKDDQRAWLYGQSNWLHRDFNGDMITTYELYHRKSLSMPKGLFALMVGDCIVSMTPLQYDTIPFDAMISDREPDSCFGYCPTWDMMAVQSSVDSVWMQMSTNRENFGTPNLFLPQGSNIEPYSVNGGRLITGTMAPEVIDLSNGGVASGQQFMEMAQDGMQRLSGLSDASIGDVSSGTSGVALTQQQSTSQAFNAPNSAAYIRMLQGMLTKQLRIAQKFIRDERMIHIAGKNRAAMVKRFKGQDFRKLKGVSIEMASASMRDSGSRHVIANELLQAQALGGDPRVAQAYMDMIATGRVEPALNGPLVQETQAERLMQGVQEGKPYIVSASMQHAMMMARLADTEADPAITPELMQIVQQLTQQHGDMWMQMSMTPEGQGLLMATGQVPHPGAQMMMQAQQAAMMPPEGNPGDAPPDAGGASPQEQPAPQDAPQPSPSGMASPISPQPSLPEGATPTA
jgi:hypothetical protein